MREGRYKRIEFFEDGHLGLYDLEADVAEQHDLSRDMPTVAKRLRKKLAAWRRSIDAKPTLPNPSYDPARVKVRGKIVP